MDLASLISLLARHLTQYACIGLPPLFGMNDKLSTLMMSIASLKLHFMTDCYRQYSILVRVDFLRPLESHIVKIVGHIWLETG